MQSQRQVDQRGNDEHKKKKANNPYGARGRPKCEACRKKKQRCNYEEDNPSSPCAYCERTGLSCGPKRYAPVREQSQRGEYSTSPESPRTIHTSHHQNAGFVATLSPPTAWRDPPNKLSELALQLERENPNRDIYQNLQRANEIVNRSRRDEDPQAAIPGPSAIQQIPPGVGNPGAHSFNTQGSGGNTQVQRRHSGSTRSSYPSAPWPQFFQAASPQGPSSDNATPGSIHERRISESQIPSQQVSSQPQVLSHPQVTFHDSLRTHAQVPPPQVVPFNNTSPGNTSTQAYQPQSSSRPRHQPHSPTHQHFYSGQTASGQPRPYGNNQNLGVSPPGAQSRAPTPSATVDVNPIQTLEDVTHTPGARFISDEAVWRDDWPPETPLQFPRSNNIVPPHSTLRPGDRGGVPPRPPPDNAEPHAISSTGAGDPMEQFWELTDSD